jgi:hypothetical protein
MCLDCICRRVRLSLMFPTALIIEKHDSNADTDEEFLPLADLFSISNKLRQVLREEERLLRRIILKASNNRALYYNRSQR